MKRIPFHKMVAAGNDFIVIDNRKKVVSDGGRFAREACRPHTGVGADGVLLVEPSSEADFLTRVINSDGSEAEACGNGFRCVGLFAHEQLGFSKTMRVETRSGIVDIVISRRSIRVRMVDPTKYRAHLALEGIGGQKTKLGCSFINTGVPHAVIFVDRVEDIDVADIGASVRKHSRFRPQGTNVDFVQVLGPDALSVRTFERGVEGETLACGTGATAAAVVSCLSGRVKTPVKVKTKSGEEVVVHMERNGRSVRNVYLEGRAKVVFSGILNV